MSLFTELKRRNVFKVAGAYLALTWVAVQITGVIAPAMHLPDWTIMLVLWIGVIGFPFVVVFSWVFELTPEGLRREGQIDRGQAIGHVTRSRLEYIIIVLLVVAIGLFVLQYVHPPLAANVPEAPAAAPAPIHSTAAPLAAGTISDVPLRRFTIALPWSAAPNWSDFGVAVSPDGTHVAYICREGNAVSLCVRAFDSLAEHRIADGRDASDWFFSPDGEWIGLCSSIGLEKVSIRGGEPQMLHRWLDSEEEPTGFSWGPDDNILFGTASGIQRVAASGGVAEPVTRIAEGAKVSAHIWPSLLPDGRSALITVVAADGTETGALVDLNDGSVRDLGVRGHGFVFVQPGWLAFQQGTTFAAVAFDPARPARVANPVPVIENARSVPRVARDGTLVYIPTRGESSARLVWVDREGRATAVPGERRDYSHLDLAPDNRRALLNVDGGAVYVLDLQGGTRKLLSKNGSFPIWSPDGMRVAYSHAGNLELMPADGSGASEALLPPTYALTVPTSWNSVTGDLAYYDHRAFEIWIRPANGPPRRFLGGPGLKRSGRFSPDGKWMAFVSDETGEYQVYVTAYPGPGPSVAVSTNGGLSPIWSPDGHELFFRLGTKMLVARMANSQPLAFSAPVELFDGPYTLDLMGHQREDVTSDGRSFLMVQNSDDFPIVVVQNWSAELAKLVH